MKSNAVTCVSKDSCLLLLGIISCQSQNYNNNHFAPSSFFPPLCCEAGYRSTGAYRVERKSTRENLRRFSSLTLLLFACSPRTVLLIPVRRVRCPFVVGAKKIIIFFYYYYTKWWCFSAAAVVRIYYFNIIFLLLLAN